MLAILWQSTLKWWQTAGFWKTQHHQDHLFQGRPQPCLSCPLLSQRQTLATGRKKNSTFWPIINICSYWRGVNELAAWDLLYPSVYSLLRRTGNKITEKAEKICFMFGLDYSARESRKGSGKKVAICIYMNNYSSHIRIGDNRCMIFLLFCFLTEHSIYTSLMFLVNISFQEIRLMFMFCICIAWIV